MRQNDDGESHVVPSDEVTQGQHRVPHHDVNVVALQRAARIVETLPSVKSQLLVNVENAVGAKETTNDREDIYGEDPGRNPRLSLVKLSIAPRLDDLSGVTPHGGAPREQGLVFVEGGHVRRLYILNVRVVGDI